MRFLGDFMATYTQHCKCVTTTGSVSLATLTQEIDTDTIAVKDLLAYKTYGSTYIYYNLSCGKILGAYVDDTLNLTGHEYTDMYVFFTNKRYISEFSWTENDAELIKAGKPVTNLTASAFNTYIDRLNALRPLTGEAIPDNRKVQPEETIPAITFQIFRSCIGDGLRRIEGRNSQSAKRIPFCSVKSAITAQILSTGEYSYKNMLNKLILAVRP